MIFIQFFTATSKKVGVFSDVTPCFFTVFSSTEFLVAVAARITVSCDVAPYILVDTFRRLTAAFSMMVNASNHLR